MPRVPPPPVPARLREMLKDYPQIIQEIQDELNRLVAEMVGSGHSMMDYDRATWVLQDILGHYREQASDEVEAAEASNDAQAIEIAKQKRLLFGKTAHRFHYGDHDLADYFRANKGAFR